MHEQETTGHTPEQRRRVSLVLQVSGLFDVGLGLALVVFGPEFLDLDFLFSAILGGGLALGGIVIWWIGRSRFGTQARDKRAEPVVKRTR